MASTVAGLSEIDPEISEDPAAWYKSGGLARAASYPAARVADAVGEYLGVRGPRCAISAACASSAMAIALAANMLLDGTVSMMLAGGSDALCPFTLSGFNSLQALDPDPCRPFDRNRKGLNLGEGAAVLVLETPERAEARHANVLAVLRGWAMTNDAFHSTAPQTQGKGLAGCMRLAMEMAEVGGDDIGYVNAHGTGTPLNDVAETNAYDSVFRERKRPIPVSSTKSYFGHCLGAAGALEATITIIAVCCGAPLAAKGCQASALRLDVADPESIRVAVESLETPDILVNVAGTNIRKGFAQYTKAEYDQVLQTNLHGIVELTQKIGARMIARGEGGKVIMIGSLMSLLGLPYLSVYAMSKGALGQLTKVLAAEWGRHNIQVNCIAPGFILTDLNRRMWEPGRMREWLKGAQANPRMGTPEDVAPLAVFLAGRGADYITGQVIPVDGGYSTTAVWPFEPES